MTSIDGLPLPDAERKIEKAHPGFHLWHSDEGHEYATIGVSDMGGSGTTLDAPSVETIEPVIGEWEWEHGHAAGCAA